MSGYRVLSSLREDEKSWHCWLGEIGWRRWRSASPPTLPLAGQVSQQAARAFARIALSHLSDQNPIEFHMMEESINVDKIGASWRLPFFCQRCGIGY